MEFNEKHVYTAVNAGELRPGDKVIVADTMANLRENVEKGTCAYVLKKVQGEECLSRFLVSEGWYPLAYIVEREENCLNCSTSCMGKSWLADKYTRCDSYKPFPLKPSKICINCEYYEVGYCHKDNRKTGYDKCCNDWLLREKRYRPFNDVEELFKVWDEKYKEKYGLERLDKGLSMPNIWVKVKKSEATDSYLIEAFGNGIQIQGRWMDWHDMFNNLTFLDGSPCGVEE